MSASAKAGSATRTGLPGLAKRSLPAELISFCAADPVRITIGRSDQGKGGGTPSSVRMTPGVSM